VAYLAGRYDALSYKDESALAAASAVAAGEYRAVEVKALVAASRAYDGPPVCTRHTPQTHTLQEEVLEAYCDEKVANRDIRVWHLVIENGY
jgi:hypothetical protein